MLQYTHMHPIVIITWEDTVGFDGWADLEDIITSELSLHHAIGWLVHETDKAFYITQSYDEVNDNYGAVQVIAKSAVIDFKMPFQMMAIAENKKVV